MLILSRQDNEQLYIGDDIVLEVTGFQDYKHVKQVQIGIKAPRHIEIKRSTKIRMQNDDSDDTEA